MNRAAQVVRYCHTAGQVRRAAQVACAAMDRSHAANRDTYIFTDGSTITVTQNMIKVN